MVIISACKNADDEMNIDVRATGQIYLNTYISFRRIEKRVTNTSRNLKKNHHNIYYYTVVWLSQASRVINPYILLFYMVTYKKYTFLLVYYVASSLPSKQNFSIS